MHANKQLRDPKIKCHHEIYKYIYEISLIFSKIQFLMFTFFWIPFWMVKLHCIYQKAFKIIKIKLKSFNLHNFTSAN